MGASAELVQPGMARGSAHGRRPPLGWEHSLLAAIAGNLFFFFDCNFAFFSSRFRAFFSGLAWLRDARPRRIAVLSAACPQGVGALLAAQLAFVDAFSRASDLGVAPRQCGGDLRHLHFSYLHF